MTERSNFFETKIEFLKGVGPQRALLLNKELNIFTYGDLLPALPVSARGPLAISSHQ